jgi:SAM-dependent methyltransferase
MRAAMPFSPVREELRRRGRELRGPGTTPGRAAAAAALGLLAGWMPRPLVMAPIVAAACILLQLDALVAAVAIVVASGARALLAHAGAASGPLASIMAGPALAAAAGAATFAIVALLPRARTRSRAPYRLPPDAPAWVQAVERVATRFADPCSPRATERAHFHYVRAKLLGDPVARLIADLAGAAPGGFGAVLDVGTGRGTLPLLLLELGRATSAQGIDWDERKIAAARRAAGAQADGAAPLRARFVRQDVRAAVLDAADTVLLVDLLHYFTEAEQDALLDRAAAAVRPGGRLLVREADPERGWRSRATLAEERLFTLVRFNRGERVCLRPVRDIAARLHAAGLRCRTLPAWGRTPFSNVLIVAERPGT